MKKMKIIKKFRNELIKFLMSFKEYYLCILNSFSLKKIIILNINKIFCINK